MFGLILKFMDTIMEIINVMVKDWRIPLSRISDRSPAIERLERLPWTTQKSLPRAPVTFDFFSLPEGHAVLHFHCIRFLGA